LVHLTDFHWDDRPIRMTSQMMDEIIQKTNDLEPDIILLTGDYVQSNPKPIGEFAERWLSKLKSKFGIFAVLGNHDYKTLDSESLIESTLKKKVGIRVLTNECVMMKELPLELIGLGDLTSGHFFPEKVLPKDPSKDHNITRICLSHNPDTARTLSHWRVNLTLSGHTHGGQIIIPSFGPLHSILMKVISSLPVVFRNLIPSKIRYQIFGVVKNWKWGSGLHKVERNAPLVGWNYLYTSRGLATHPPMRLFCDPEIAVLTLLPLQSLNS